MAVAGRGGRVNLDDVRIGPLALPGHFTPVVGATGVVLFAHGSGSSRLSPRNQRVAEFLRDQGLSTLLIDLLGPDEADDRERVFDIDLLASRVAVALDWLAVRTGPRHPSIGLFGASTGAAAALQAAALRPAQVMAVVSRGGRPDLAGAHLGRVQAPTLLIVGGDDPEVLALNRQALRQLSCEKRLDVVPGATHLFEEPGALESVAQRAADWFTTHLNRRTP